ncbi:MAG TPA: permease, partial [Acidisoma sp.]|nr:permease [Acidisoma sp.]
TYPKKLVEEARRFPETGGHGHDHGGMSMASGTVWQKLGRRETWVQASHSFVMDWQMLWKDIVLGFVIAGALGAFVPDGVWQTLFVRDASPWIQVPANALLGPIVAMLSFVCSIGNVPMAAILWGSGVSFGGVLAFLFADLIVLPLLDVYRRTYGWKMAAYIGGVFYATMVIAALVMDLAFNAVGWIPERNPRVQAEMIHFSLNYTFWLNILLGLVAVGAVILAKRNPMQMAPRHCCGHGGAKAKDLESIHADHHHH